MFEKIDALIYFEHVSRELDAATLLKRRLKSEGVNAVTVPLHSNRYWNLIRYRPKVFVVPFYYSKHNIQITKIITSYYQTQPTIINLHQEQISGPKGWSFFLPSDELSRSVIHFSWGPDFSRKLSDSGCLSSSIHEVGSIRAEIGHRLSKKTQRIINNSFKKRILVTLTFGFAFYSKEYIQNILKLGRLDAIEEQKRTTESLVWFTKELNKLVETSPNIHFEIRPHPSDPPGAYAEIKKLLGDKTNASFNSEDSIYDRLMTVDALITTTSTTAIEAQLTGVPSACLVQKSDLAKMDFIQFWNNFNRAEDVREWIRSGCQIKESMNNYLATAHGNYLNASQGSAEIIRDYVKRSNNVKMHLLTGLIYLIWKTISIDVPKYILSELKLLTMMIPFYRRVESDMYPAKAYAESEKKISRIM